MTHGTLKPLLHLVMILQDGGNVEIGTIVAFMDSLEGDFKSVVLLLLKHSQFLCSTTGMRDPKTTNPSLNCNSTPEGEAYLDPSTSRHMVGGQTNSAD